jgi:alcohol dehydrogenase YqhD (iron-dependent ADH family)
MQNFTYKLNTKVIFGWGEISRVGEETRDLGRSALLVTGKGSTRKHGYLDKAVASLAKAGVKTTIFEGVEPNPRDTTVDRGAAVARDNDCEVVVALGGGSAVDAAKGIAVGAIAGKPIWNFIYSGPGRSVESHHTALPIVAVPTIAAAGSEFGSGAVITRWETHEKSLLLGDHLFPKVAIVDPELTVTVPRATTGDGGVDIISHALDNYISNTETTPLQDRFSESVMRTVIEFLGTAMDEPQNREARTQLSWASTMANSGVLHKGRNGAGPMHFIEHTLSGHFDISHGRGLATVMPALFTFNNEANPMKYAQLASNVFGVNGNTMSDKERGEKGIQALEKWMKSIGMYTRLKDLGIRPDCFPTVADDSLRVYEILGGGDGALLNPARRLDKAGIIAVLQGCA